MTVAVTSYYGTGSSAVLDLLSEYEPCFEGNFRHFEHVPFYFPNGLFDLEYKLLQGNDPHRSDEAIKSFRHAMYELDRKNFTWFGTYQQYFGSQFKDNVDEFLSAITQFTCTGSWYNYYQRGRLSLPKILKDCIKTVMNRPLFGEFGRLVPQLTEQELELSFISPEEFYAHAKVFVKKYLDMFRTDPNGIMLIDHLLLPHNANRIDNYFDDDFRLIVVDRDIRDMFVLCTYIWPDMGFPSPYPTQPEKFLAHRNNMKRAEQRIDHPHILYLNFEDLIYRYEETVAKIEKFAGLTPQQHVRPRTRFIPENSINNTQNFRIKEEWEQQTQLFVGKTEDIYDFPYIRKADIKDTFDNQE